MIEDALPIGIHQALPLTLSNISAVGTETLPGPSASHGIASPQ